MVYLLTAIVCLVVGLLIGWTGVAGFLLPMFFTSYLALPVPEAMALSFVCFAVSGLLGAWNYHRAGKLPLRPGLYLAAGSLAGSLLGAALNQMIPAGTVKIILYVVVLLSGASILLRRGGGKESGGLPSVRFVPLAALGLVTGCICALSGAGGPVLVMPLLLLLGFPAHTAVGIALFDSIFIALPAAAVYLTQGIPPVSIFAAAIAAHAIGILLGSRTAHFVPAGTLKKIVGVFSVLIAIYMLIFR